MEAFFDAGLKIRNPAMYSGLKKLSVNFCFICQLPKIGLSDLMFSIKAMSLKADDILKKYLNENGASRPGLYYSPKNFSIKHIVTVSEEHPALVF